MELKSYAEGIAMIVEIIGRLDTLTSADYEKQMTQLIDDGNKIICADCTQLEYISSSGLRVLLMTLKSITNSGGKLVLFGMKEAVLEVFKICRFDSLFNIVADKEEALSAVK